MRRLRRFDNALELLRSLGPRERHARLVVLLEVLQEEGAERRLRAVDPV